MYLQCCLKDLFSCSVQQGWGFPWLPQLPQTAGACSLQPGHPRKEQEGSAEAGVRKVGMIWKAKEQECQCLAQFCSTASEAVPCSWTWAWGWDFKPASNFGEKLNGLKFSSSFSSSSSLLRIQS